MALCEGLRGRAADRRSGQSFGPSRPRQREGAAVCFYIFWEAEGKIRNGSADLQGFLSRNLVNISEALTVLLASPRRLRGVRRCVRILTSAAVRHGEGEGGLGEGAAAASCLLFTGSGRKNWVENIMEERKKKKRKKAKQKVQRRYIRRHRAPNAAKFRSA